MENAIRALLMVGGLLIAIMVISFMVFVLRKGGQMSAEYDSHLSEDELAKFNSQFEAFSGETNTFFDIITVSNLARDINKKNGYDAQTGVTIKIYLERNNIVQYQIEPRQIQKNYFLDRNGNEKYMYDVMKENNFTETSYDANTDTITYQYTFKCEKILYNEITGKVHEMSFRLN